MAVPAACWGTGGKRAPGPQQPHQKCKSAKSPFFRGSKVFFWLSVYLALALNRVLYSGLRVSGVVFRAPEAPNLSRYEVYCSTLWALSTTRPISTAAEQPERQNIKENPREKPPPDEPPPQGRGESPSPLLLKSCFGVSREGSCASP